MWSSVLALTLLLAIDPVKLGITLLLISRPRPVLNLFAYWGGAMILGVPYVLIPLILLHVTPMFRSFAQDLATPATVASSTVRHIQIGIGVLALSAAALMAVRFLVRQRAHRPTPGGNTSTLVLDSNTPTAISRLLGRAEDAPTEGRSPIRRLLGSPFRPLLRRARNAWENGSLWVPLVIGMSNGSPPPFTILVVVTTIMASGAAIGTQLSAAIVFAVGAVAVVEIILASYLATPAKTQAVLQLLHDWVRAHTRQILVAMLAMVGVALVAQGMG